MLISQSFNIILDSCEHIAGFTPTYTVLLVPKSSFKSLIETPEVVNMKARQDHNSVSFLYLWLSSGKAEHESHYTKYRFNKNKTNIELINAVTFIGL